MHAIQTSGNCIRNITSDAFAGVAGDEYVDPRPVCELLRQWSTLHPEFAYLPRKFKFAINGAKEDRTVLLCHDVGIELKKNSQDELLADIYAGGGMGRTDCGGTATPRNGSGRCQVMEVRTKGRAVVVAGISVAGIRHD
jgi:sulfite reductase (NADPH) hemoprotein beta-component